MRPWVNPQEERQIETESMRETDRQRTYQELTMRQALLVLDLNSHTTHKEYFQLHFTRDVERHGAAS